MNDLIRRLGLIHPVIQAPMAGGGDTPELVAAVSEAGGIGFIGAAYLTPEQIIAAARAVRERTLRPFGINLFAPLPVPDVPRDAASAVDRVKPFFDEMRLPEPSVPLPMPNPFPEQLAATLETGAAAFSFVFGLIPQRDADAVKQRGMMLMGTATTVEEALAAEKLGVDAVIAQGGEAGGHRGTFLGDAHDGVIGTMALVPQIVDAVRVPVVAAGGIMDGRGIAAALMLGASAVQMGTAFLTCDEAGVSEAYKEAILTAHEDQTRLTRAFSGRYARGIVNRFLTTLGDDNILPFPLQNALTRPLRSAASKQGRAEFLSLWAGQGMRMARKQSAAALMERLASETRAALERVRA